MSGGGSSTITLPVYLMLGISLPMASFLNKTTAIFWIIPVSYNYLKNRKINYKFLIPASLTGLIGVYFGVNLIININQNILEIIIGVLILILVLYTYFKKDLGLKNKKIRSKLRKSLIYPASLIMGLYEGILGAGNGIIFSVISFYTRGCDFIHALGNYFFIAFFWCIFASALFIKAGYFDLKLLIVASLGSILGGYLGSKYAKYKGNHFIKTVFIITGTILGIKLILQGLGI
jgi:hypothetical protein